MNWKRISRRLAAPASILAVSVATLGLTSCTLDYTLAYMYVTTSKSNVINQFAVDYQSGAVVQFGTPVASGNDPVASVASPDAKSIYVVNQGDSTVQQFTVGGNGALTAVTAVATGNTPTGVAIDTLGKFLYVTYKYQAGFSATNPGPGGISIFPIGSSGALGTATNVNVGNDPVAVAIANFNATVYVVDQEVTAANPQVLAFSEDTSTGALTPVAGTTATTGYAAGVTPSAIAEDPTGRFVYVTDQAANQLIGYVVGAGGGLTAMVNGPFATRLFPVAVTVDPRGEYVYVANYNARSISSYALNKSTGTPSGTTGSGITTDPNPVSIAIDPALGIYLYTANNLASTVTGEKLNANTGVLAAIQNSPFPASGTPTSVVFVANGSHPTELLYP
jgi:6-phosphogluconolactonase